MCLLVLPGEKFVQDPAQDMWEATRKPRRSMAISTLKSQGVQIVHFLLNLQSLLMLIG